MITKKITSYLICFLLVQTIFMAAITTQTANAQLNDNDCGETFEFEGGANLVLYNVVGNIRVFGAPTQQYPPLPEEEPNDEIPSIRPQLTAIAVDETESEINENTAWNIIVVGRGTFSRGIVGLPYFGSTPEDVEMWQIDLLRGDVNADGKVNCKDTYLIRKAMYSSRWARNRCLRAKWNPACDLNKDGKITWTDMRIAYRNYGKTAQWEPLENVWSDGIMIYGTTDHFSIFRGR